MKKKQHLPLTGVGPIYVAIIIACTVAEIVASRTVLLRGGRIEAHKIPFGYWGNMTDDLTQTRHNKRAEHTLSPYYFICFKDYFLFFFGCGFSFPPSKPL